MNRILLWVGMLFINSQVFAQTPYNVVVNISQDPKTQMAFNWFCDAGVTNGQVEIIGVKTVNATCTQHSGYTENKVIVTGLLPNTTYSFKVCNNNSCSDIGVFTTAESNKDPFTFIYTTDPQATTPGQFDTASMTTHAAFAKFPEPKFWLDCGDLVNDDGKQGQWDDFFSTQKELFLKTPFAPIRGNHDGSTNFRCHFNTENFGKTDTTGSTYTFVYGDAQFFALNSELYNKPAYIDSVKKWMRKQVNDNPNVKWRIVYYHKIIYTGGLHQDNSDGKVWRDAMAPLFDELNIDIAFQGHDHVYEVIGPVKNKELVPDAVSNLVTVSPPNQNTSNITGKLGGTYNVREGTLYFLNGSNGYKQYKPNLLNNMPDSTITDVSNYPSLFTGCFGQTYNPTYSHVSVSTDSIVITTYEIVNGSSALLDEIMVVKNNIEIQTQEKEQLKIYPNPTTGELQVTGDELQVTNVEIFDIMGKNVSCRISHIAHPISIDISHFPSGIYFVKIITDTGVIVKKVVKQ